MAFSDNLDKIILILHVSSAELSRAAGLDASLISRFRKGKRVPQKGRTQYNKLIHGIHILAISTDKEAYLLALCSGDNTINNKFTEVLDAWLSPEVTNTGGARCQKNIPNVSTELFSNHFSLVMDFLSVSNVRLAKFLNLDASLISRYRNGLRTPRYNSDIASKICIYFVNRAKTQHQIAPLYELIGSGSDLNLYILLYSYLYCTTLHTSMLVDSNGRGTDHFSIVI